MTSKGREPCVNRFLRKFRGKFSTFLWFIDILSKPYICLRDSISNQNHIKKFPKHSGACNCYSFSMQSRKSCNFGISKNSWKLLSHEVLHLHGIELFSVVRGHPVKIRKVLSLTQKSLKKQEIAFSFHSLIGNFDMNDRNFHYTGNCIFILW